MASVPTRRTPDIEPTKVRPAAGDGRRELVRLDPGTVARITLDHPPLNILTIPMLDELAEAVRGADAHPDTKVLLLRGAGKAFCAGVDVSAHTADRVDSMIDAFARVVEALRGCVHPVVAAVDGAALGGGCEILLACDVVLAAESAPLGQPEIRLGVFPPAAAALLPRLVGRRRALDLILTGRTVPAGDPAARGIVTRVYPDDRFGPAVEEYLDRLAALSRPVLALAKRVVVEGLDRPVGDALHHADELYLDELMELRDPHEGLAAFMEKRDPVWSDT